MNMQELDGKMESAYGDSFVGIPNGDDDATPLVEAPQGLELKDEDYSPGKHGKANRRRCRSLAETYRWFIQNNFIAKINRKVGWQFIFVTFSKYCFIILV